MLREYFIKPFNVFTDNISDALSKKYDTGSYKGILTLPDDLKQFDPFFVVSKYRVIGLTFPQALCWRSPSLDNYYTSSQLKESYESASENGLLRKVPEFARTFACGISNEVYFPTETLLQKVLEKR